MEEEKNLENKIEKDINENIEIEGKQEVEINEEKLKDEIKDEQPENNNKEEKKIEEIKDIEGEQKEIEKEKVNNNEENEPQIKEDSNNKEEEKDDEKNNNEDHEQEEIQEQKQEEVNENQNEENKEEDKEKENNKEEVNENNIEENKEEATEGNKDDNIIEENNIEDNKEEEENNKEEVKENIKEDDKIKENIEDGKEEENNDDNIQDNKENEDKKDKENKSKEIEENEYEIGLENNEEEIKEETEKEEVEEENSNKKGEIKEKAEEKNEIEEKENIKKEEENKDENKDKNKEEKNEEKEQEEIKEEEKKEIIEENNGKKEEKNRINEKETNISEINMKEGQISKNEEKEDKNDETQENNNKKEDEIKEEKKIEKKEEIKPKKEENKKEDIHRGSFSQPQNNLKNTLLKMNINNKKEDTNTQPKKAAPKKLDANKFKYLIGSRLIGQIMKKPNELMKKEEPKITTTTTSENPKDETPQSVKENSHENTLETSIPTQSSKLSTPLSLKREEDKEFNPTKLYKSETLVLDKEMEIYSKNIKIKDEGRISNNSPLHSKTSKRSSVAANFGFEVLDMDLPEDDSIDNCMNEEFLNSMNYEEFLTELKKQGKKEESRETFCEGFFIASFPKENGNVIENSSEKLPAPCGHEECSKLPSMKPEIIMRYPLKDTKNLELNNLAATICFPTGIKLCYTEGDFPAKIEDYVTQITNQKGERYYMRTFHFYHKMQNIEFTKEYKIHPLKHHLMKFGDEYTILNEEQFTDEIVNNIQKNLDFCQELGFRDIVYIPYCICLISKYPYINELGNCLNTIYKIMAQEPGKLNFEINELIMYLIHSVPIPIKNMRIRFYIPYNSSKMELLCPKVDDVSIMNSTFTKLFDYLSIDNIILVFRLLLSEKKILFIHDDYTELTNITNSFISLLYPFKWVHTYIPIMSDQMLKYLETFLPFLNGIHKSLMKFVEDIFKEGELEESDEVFLVYINKDDLGEITLSSSLKKGKVKFSKYIQNHVLPLPFEKDLKKELKSIESQRKALKKESKTNIIDSHLENKMRDAFIDIFVKMFHDYEKYIGILDEDVIFNKVLFMNKVTKDEKFYDEFIDCQLFQQFTQNILKDNYSYFNKKIKELKENKKKGKKSDKSFRTSINKKESLYLTRPDYLGIKENDKIIIEEKLKQDYKLDKNVLNEVKTRILEKLNPIDSNKYINSNCIIYLTPEKKDSTKEEENSDLNKKLQTIKQENKPMIKKTTTLLAGGELTEKQIEKIKDDVKDMTIKIFKSEIKNEDIKTLRTEAFRNLETSYGRSFFVSLISNNSTNVISLQENSFGFLENLINGILNSILKLEETEQIIEEIVILIRSTKYFEKEVKKKDKSSKKVNITLFDNMKKKLQSYSKISQSNLWEKWNELDLKKLDEEEKEDNQIKEDLIIKICEVMSELEIAKTTIKKNCQHINKNTFEENSEMYTKTEKRYMDIIKSSKFISSAK